MSCDVILTPSRAILSIEVDFSIFFPDDWPLLRSGISFELALLLSRVFCHLHFGTCNCVLGKDAILRSE
jgi:hypothetical protein